MNEPSPMSLSTRFRQRANTLRALAYTVLALVAGSLGGGVYLFVIAGELTSQDIAKAQRETFDLVLETAERALPQTTALLQNVRLASSESAAAASQLDDLVTETTRTVQELAELFESVRLYVEDVDGELAVQFADFAEPVSEDLRVTVGNVREATEYLPVLFQNLTDVSEESLLMVQELPAAIKDVTDNASADAPAYSALLSTLTTRVGALLILVFLVQILINLYRYNIRLAAYYDARADAIEIAMSESFEEMSMVDLVHILSPEAVDFGKSAQSPVQHAVDLARELMARDRSKA